MGTKGDWEANKTALVEAAAKAGVKVYIPSEFGTDHLSFFRQTGITHPLFISKQKHMQHAKELGLQVHAVYIALIMEMAFSRWFGVDTQKRKWSLVGTGEEKWALTSLDDVGFFVLRVCEIALEEGGKERLGEHVRVYSECWTYKEYAGVFERFSGDKLELEFTPVQEKREEYERIKHTIPPHLLGPLIGIAGGEGIYDHIGLGDKNEILLKGAKWKTRSLENYAEEVRGKPWDGVDLKF
ncbi:hypothetical protein BT69DRAFT_1277049 [Atractiella rhizophila]|nr:hypothetical protein BT69DRAFT_1277049 [Atractiella rhizophila]